MEGNTIPVSEGTTVIVKVSGDLFLQGEGEMEVRFRSSEERVRVNQTNENLYIETHASLDVSVPRTARVIIEKVGGSAFIQDLEGALTVQKIGGDLALRRIGELQIEKVGGSCMAEDIHQPAVIQKVGGDLSVRHAVSPFDATMIGGTGSLEIAGEGAVSIRAGGDLRAFLYGQTGGPVSLRAGGELTAVIPENANLQMVVDSSAENIQISLNRQAQALEKVIEERRFETQFGEGAAVWELRAGGDMRINDHDLEPESIGEELERRAAAWIEARDRGGNVSWTGGFGFDRTSAWADMISRRAQEAARRAEQRTQAAMRRTEDQIRRAAEREMRRGEGGFNFNFPGSPPVPPHVHQPHQPVQPPVPPAPRVSAQERMLVLQMLQEGKISIEQAESLLAALEGHG